MTVFNLWIHSSKTSKNGFFVIDRWISATFWKSSIFVWKTSRSSIIFKYSKRWKLLGAISWSTADTEVSAYFFLVRNHYPSVIGGHQNEKFCVLKICFGYVAKNIRDKNVSIEWFPFRKHCEWFDFMLRSKQRKHDFFWAKIRLGNR
mgnify:CR=1 FL=1